MTVQNLTYRFTLDTFKNGVQRILQGFQTGESVARKMIISLVSGSESYELPLANITVAMYVKRPSQESPSINACTIDSENNAILYDILNEDIAEAGIVEMQLKIIDSISGKVLISPKFGMEVWESNIEDSDAEDSPTFTALEAALAQATAMKDSAIADLYIDDDTNIFTVVFGDGTTYTSTVIADALAKIDNVEGFSLKAEGFAVGEQNGVPVASESPYYQNNAKYYAENAGSSATNALASEQNASVSEANALSSEQNAASSEASASASETSASESATSASASASSASTSATSASTSATNAAASEANAASSEASASASEASASASASSASTSATNASTSETNALAYSKTSQSYAVGGSGTRQGEDSDNAKYYKEVCEQIAGGMEGGFIPMGTILFAALPTASQDKKGWMYNISDEFVTDARFKDGSGKKYAAGTNVYLTADMLWDCLSGVVPTVNGKNGNSITLDGSDILVTGYTEASAESDIAPSDSINTSLGKLEKKANNNKSSVSSLESRATSLEGRATSLEGRASALETSVGNASNLTTTSKEVVGAINEHDAEIGDASKVADRIGSFSKLNYEITEGELRITYEDYQKVINDEPIVIKGLVVQDYVNEIDYTYCVLAAENVLHIYETEDSQSYINISGVQWAFESTDLSSKIEKNQEAIRSLNSNLTELEQEIPNLSTMRYNVETDMIQLKDALGVWHDWKRGGLAEIDLLHDEIWSAYGGTCYSGGNLGTPTLTTSADTYSVRLNSPMNSTARGCIITNNKVNLTPAQTLTIDVGYTSDSDSTACQVAFVSAKSSRMESVLSCTIASGRNLTRKTLTFDVSALSGEYYVVFDTRIDNYSTVTYTIYGMTLS